MKRIAFIALLLNALLLPSLAAAQQSQKAPFLWHPRHREFLANAKTAYSSVMAARSLQTGPTTNIVRTWDLGTYNGAAWVELSAVNDFAIAVGTGDIGTNETRTLLVPLFGPNAGQWMDLGSLGGQILDWDEPLLGISNTGLVATHSYLTAIGTPLPGPSGPACLISTRSLSSILPFTPTTTPAWLLR
jgi:hypothetical protein